MNENRYFNAIDNLDVSEKFKMDLIEKIKMQDEIKRKVKINNSLRSKIITLIAIIQMFLLGGVAYATIVPQEWKDKISIMIDNLFGIETDFNYEINVQENTLEQIVNSEVKNKEKYSKLLDPDTYGIGDSNGGTNVESNYEQYNCFGEFEEGVKLKKYSKPIEIKIGDFNYSVVEELDSKMTIFDDDGRVLERKEFSLEDILEYQKDVFMEDLDSYVYDPEIKSQVKFKDLYFKITGMTFMNGNNTSDEDFKNYSRAKKIKVIFNDGESEEIINLKDTSDVQFVDFDFVQKDVSKPVNIKIEVLEKYEGNKSDDVYLADVQVGIDSNIPKGR